LKKVIARVDFASPVESLQKKLPPAVSAALLKAFPISEPKKTVGKEFKISQQDTEERAIEQMNWFHYSKDRQKRACLSLGFFWVEYDVYSSFEELRSDFLSILVELFNSIEELQVIRFGLRYIDHITFGESNVFEWSDYLHESLLAAFSIPHEGKQIIRAFNNFTVSDDDMILQFRYGMHNPDYPALIKKKLFVLDTDAYTQGLLEFREIQAKLEIFHEAIGSLFEQVITNGLREKMGVINAD
jgi:uncharacterized protein (TIGR04255 family)